MTDQATICAITTGHGGGAVSMIRLSGEEAIQITDSVFSSPVKGKTLSTQKANTLHFGSILDDGNVIDEVIVSIFKAPHSFTGEDVVEITCHGSIYIQQRLLQLFIRQGARLAKPGEFTQRAFLNGKMDLSQAEAVADLIASTSGASHKVAMNQMRGGFSGELIKLREQLLNFTALVELELDFSEEDVEFADRSQLHVLADNIEKLISRLVDSFQLGNAIKNGIPVAIAGETNVGKSTLLNALLNEEKAIVSEIEGTTRDVIEDVINIEGIAFRFIDTAGIRDTQDKIETLGIERTFKKINQASIVLLLIDLTRKLSSGLESLAKIRNKISNQKLIIVGNKIDKKSTEELNEFRNDLNLKENESLVFISAKHGDHIDQLREILLKTVDFNRVDNNEVIVTNVRHYEALTLALKAIRRVIEGLDQHISGDFLAQDIRECIHYLGEITGQISNDEILVHIFKHFCIGK
ncbi:MAG: tRNA uridine-5-carboxymethylaminomethyl(34) synthesis GTPase MnmE [Bacteroidota bacterium]|nr:tRNA uridine-5-carboxymethylaminomethyl(34) synthesis GTPase MnmE [Bacteroidota bacterium]